MAQVMIPRIASGVIRFLRATIRLRCSGLEHLRDLRSRGLVYIHAFWHGHLLLMPYAYPGGRMAVMISEHRDGEYIARTMERFGHRSVRGSTTSGGAAALRQAVRLARDGYDLGFTPDGPRGPRHKAQMGVVMAARLSGLPILPVAFAASPAKMLGSWDRFVVPMPFSRAVFAYGEPLRVDSGAREQEMEAARRKVEDSLIGCCEEASACVSDSRRFQSLPLLGTLS
jgi:lysophospholipid acyltransferase (LPLAT)-like uncharacterized protein